MIILWKLRLTTDLKKCSSLSFLLSLVSALASICSLKTGTVSSPFLLDWRKFSSLARNFFLSEV